MEKIIIIAIWLLVVIGAFYVVSGVFVTGSRKSNATVRKYFKKKKTGSNNTVIDNMLNTAAKHMSKYVVIDDIKRSEYRKLLFLSGDVRTPEEYLAYQYIFCGAVALVGLLFAIFNKIGLLLVIFAVLIYIHNIRNLKKTEQEVRHEIEKELPKFVAYVKEVINTNPDALSVLTQYRSSNEVFERELKYTIADIRSSNFISGISRFERRIGSQQLKQVISGLISIYNGTYDKFYFTMLENDFSAEEINALKAELKKLPNKMQLPKILLVMSVMITVMTPLILTIIDTAGDIFK